MDVLYKFRREPVGPNGTAMLIVSPHRLPPNMLEHHATVSDPRVIQRLHRHGPSIEAFLKTFYLSDGKTYYAHRVPNRAPQDQWIRGDGFLVKLYQHALLANPGGWLTYMRTDLGRVLEAGELQLPAPQ